jgi:hypothetical protein
MPLLEDFMIECMIECQNQNPNRPSIKDLSPLSACHRLKKFYGNVIRIQLMDLSTCADLKLDALQFSSISRCTLITNLTPLSAHKSLRVLDCCCISPHLPSPTCARVLVSGQTYVVEKMR